MELYVYDDKINLLGVIDQFSSLRWRRKYYEPGEFELHVALAKENLQLFSPLLTGEYGQTILLHRLDRPECGIAHQVQMKDRDLVISGYMLSFELQYLAVLGRYNFQNSLAEQAMHQLFTDAISRGGLGSSAPVDGSRCGSTERLTKQVTNKPLLKVLTDISKVSQVGFRVRLDPVKKARYFDTYQGVDRSITQTQNSRVIFGDTFDNLNNSEAIYADTDFYDYAIVLGEERSNGDRVTVIVDKSDPQLWPRRELLVDARDLQRDEGMTESEYLDMLRMRGEEKLWNSRITESLESDVVITPNFEYIKDWDLGDIVTLDKSSWERRWEQIRITEVEEIYEGNTERIIPVFGNPLPEFWGIGSD